MAVFLKCTPECFPGEYVKITLIEDIINMKIQLRLLRNDNLSRETFFAYVNLGTCGCSPISALQLAAWVGNLAAFKQIYEKCQHLSNDKSENEVFTLLMKPKVARTEESWDLSRGYITEAGLLSLDCMFSKKDLPLEEFVTAPISCIGESPLSILLSDDKDKPCLVDTGVWYALGCAGLKKILQILQKSPNQFDTPQSRNIAITAINKYDSHIDILECILKTGAPVPELRVFLGGDEYTCVLKQIPLHPLVIFRIFTTRQGILHVVSIQTVYSQRDYQTPKIVQQARDLELLDPSCMQRGGGKYYSTTLFMMRLYNILLRFKAEISITSIDGDYEEFKHIFCPGMKTLADHCRTAVFQSVQIPYVDAIDRLELPVMLKSHLHM